MRYADLISLSYRTVISHKLRSSLTALSLVPKLQLGNPVSEALGNCSLRCSTSCIHAVAASRDWKLEPFDKTQDSLPEPNFLAGAWELAKPVAALAKR